MLKILSMNNLLHHISTATYYLPNYFTNKEVFSSPKGTDGVWGPHSPFLMGIEFPLFGSQTAELRGCSV